MKKFLTRVPLQVRGNLQKVKYMAADNKKLQMDKEVSFPILTAVNGYVQENEELEILAVIADTEAEENNYQELCRQAEEICEKKNTGKLTVRKIVIKSDQNVLSQVESFQKLIDYIDDNDEVFVCMTFGTKPQSQVMIMAAQYAYRVKENVSIECVLYGEVPRSSGKDNETLPARVYNMTGLIQIDEVVRILAERKVQNPKKILDQILAL